MSTIPLALYVHVPWCVRKCPYCDFNSHALRGEAPERDYVDALLLDLDAEAARAGGRVLRSIFVGGGTPSLLDPASVARLLEGVGARLALAADCEITLEANPGTVERARFAALRDAGVNRLSIGVQSFDDAILARIGRIHDAGDAHRAVEAAHRAGFDDVNVDLMFGLPGQSVEGALADVDRAVGLAPTHVSHYELTIEPNTLFHREPPPRPDEDAIEAMRSACAARLARAGYRRYEVSALALRGRRCRHNLNYWRYGDYLGIGAGAHGKLTRGAVVERCAKHRHPRRYLEAARDGGFDHSRRACDPADVAFEFVLNAARLVDGFTLDSFEARTGLPASAIESRLADAEARGLVTRRARRIRPTAHGRRFLDDLVASFLPEDARDGCYTAGSIARSA